MLRSSIKLNRFKSYPFLSKKFYPSSCLFSFISNSKMIYHEKIQVNNKIITIISSQICIVKKASLIFCFVKKVVDKK